MLGTLLTDDWIEGTLGAWRGTNSGPKGSTVLYSMTGFETLAPETRRRLIMVLGLKGVVKFAKVAELAGEEKTFCKPVIEVRE